MEPHWPSPAESEANYALSIAKVERWVKEDSKVHFLMVGAKFPPTLIAFLKLDGPGVPRRLKGMHVSINRLRYEMDQERRSNS